MKIEIKHLLSFIPLVGTMESISTDVAIIKEKIMWMEEFMIKTYEGDF